MAFEVLRRVEEGAFASVLLASATRDMHGEDRGLCYELVLGVLRWQLWLDRLAEHYAGRKAETLDEPVRRALRLGLYQLRFLTRIPAPAAVNEAVNLAYEARLRSAAAFINAVLRRATREPNYDPAVEIPDPIERVSVATSHPAWLIKRWVTAFGAGEAEAMARTNNHTPPVAFRVNELRAESRSVMEKLREAGMRAEASRLAPCGWRVEGASDTSLREAVQEGLIYIQDEASQLVGHIVGAQAGERILDVCAAPGSKTTQIAALAGDRALVVAGDLYEHRLRMVRESAARQGLKSIRVVAHDMEAALPFADGSFDRVLVDAPCTGTGTLRRNPEIRWRITGSDIIELAARQRRILLNAARAVCHGGRLVYSTCSVEREENEEVTAAFQAARGDFAALARVPFLNASGTARTWPHRDGTDGFFVAAFVRQ